MEVIVESSHAIWTRSFEQATRAAAQPQRFLSLFLQSEREVFRYVAALVPCVADAEDIVQQTAVALWENFESYDPARPFTPWACRFALNKARQWIERRQRWQALLEGGLAEELMQRREALRPELEVRLRNLEGCLGKLPDDQRSLVVGYYYEARRDRRRFPEEFGKDGGSDLQGASADPASSSDLRGTRCQAWRGCVKIEFPSNEFDDGVAAVCHGLASDEQCQAINELLRNDAAALDEYIIRLELHSRLASERDLFASAGPLPDSVFIEAESMARQSNSAEGSERSGRNKRKIWTTALAAGLALLAAAVFTVQQFRSTERSLATSKAVAMLNRTADAQWNQGNEIPRLGAPLEPSRLRLEAGLAEVLFYSGARLLMEGPADVKLVSQNGAFCRRGRFVAEVPEQARGFRIETPHTVVTDMGASFGLEVQNQASEIHVFKGNINLSGGGQAPGQILPAGSGALIGSALTPRLIAARPASFASLFDLEARSAAADARIARPMAKRL